MLRATNNTALLHPQNRLICCFSSQVWIRAEALPIATSLRNSAHVHHRSQGDVHAFSDVLAAHEEPAQPDEPLIERGSGVDTCRE